MKVEQAFPHALPLSWESIRFDPNRPEVKIAQFTLQHRVTSLNYAVVQPGTARPERVLGM